MPRCFLFLLPVISSQIIYRSIKLTIPKVEYLESNPPLCLQLIRKAKHERSRSPFSFAYFRWYPTTLTVVILGNAARRKPAMVLPFRLFPASGICFSYDDRSSTSEKTTLNFADNTEVFQSEYSQHAILRSAHFRRVVKTP